jgi:hypothetical protein
VSTGSLVNGFHAFIGRVVYKNAQFAVHNGVLVPTLMYGRESWVWHKKRTSRINVTEMRE